MNGIHRGIEGGGDFGKLSAAQQVQVVTNDPRFQTFLLATGGQLEKQSFGKVAGGHAGRVERLDQSQGLRGDLERDFGGGGNLGQFRTQKTVLIQIANHLLRPGADFRSRRGKGELRMEVVREGFGKNPGFEERLSRVKAGLMGEGGGSGPVGIPRIRVRIVLGVGGLLRFRGVQRRGFFFQDGVGLQFRLEEVL